MKEKAILKYIKSCGYLFYKCWDKGDKLRLAERPIRGPQPAHPSMGRSPHAEFISFIPLTYWCREKHLKLFCISFVFLFLTNCTCSGGKNRTDFEIFHDMIQQKNIKAQEGDKEGTFMRRPPENTRARNREYYPYKNDPERAEKNLKNPFKGQFSPEMIGIGKRQYEKACIYCHGATGAGEGKVAQKMTIKPPSLLADKAIGYSDGRLYHIIHEGQGLMSSYRKQVRGEKERWALINYVRMLQKQAMEEK